MHAESPAVPDVGWRLTASGRLPAAAWDEAVEQGGPDYRAGALLVERGRLSRGELELCHLSALFDAAYFILSPLDRDQPAPDRFLAHARHWFGPVRPVPVPLLQREMRAAQAAAGAGLAAPGGRRRPGRPRPRHRRVRARAGRADVRPPRRPGRRRRDTDPGADRPGARPPRLHHPLRRPAARGGGPGPDPRNRRGPRGRTPARARGTPPGAGAVPEISLLYRIRDALEAL
ncbi:transcriptional regulator [Streptomyces stramineus]